MEFEELTEKVIGCAFIVYSKLGFGYMETIYEKALIIELEKAGLNVKQQIAVKVHYDGFIIGEFIADLLINDVLLVELKSVRIITKAHESQLVNYIVATKVPVGLLINFGECEVQIRRRTLNWKSGKFD